ncbi:MAG: molybdenum cofactor biosynthesis protein MoaE [Gemmatimonadetes bacterium]|nr:molybdenum cofactor biosynthesis protein MoaE [Gemmatimonadota bacterium]
MHPRTGLTSDAIDPARVLAAVGTHEDGAVALFLGTVRRRNDGREVIAMRYDAYAAMAERVLEQIASEAVARWNPSSLAVVHRTGELMVGEISVAIAVSTPHRAEAFDAARYVIEEIKRRLPVWKQEQYSSGERAWLDGRPPVQAGHHE